MAGQGSVWLGLAWRGRARLGRGWLGKACVATARLGQARQGKELHMKEDQMTRRNDNPRMLSPAALAKEAAARWDHRVGAVNYTEKDRSDGLAAGTMECSCGWQGDAWDLKVYRDHRKEALAEVAA